MRDATNMFAWDRAHVEVVNWELCLGVKGQVGTFGGGRFLPQRSRTETSAKRGRRPQLRKCHSCKVEQFAKSCTVEQFQNEEGGTDESEKDPPSNILFLFCPCFVHCLGFGNV